MNYIIRPMQDRDIAQALEIDREAFPTQWPHPSYSSFKQELRNRLARYIIISEPRQIETTVPNEESKSLRQRLLRFFAPDRLSNSNEEISASRHEYVVGIAGFWVMVDEAHITTLGVRNAYRRRGIGERLLIEIVDMATELKAHVVTLEVRVSNKEAQALYRKYRFQKVGIRRGYYSDNGEDAVLMTTDPLGSSTFQSQFQMFKGAHRQRWPELFVADASKVS